MIGLCVIPKAKRCKCFSFIVGYEQTVSIEDLEKPIRGSIILKQDEMAGLIKDIKDGKWDGYYSKFLKDEAE